MKIPSLLAAAGIGGLAVFPAHAGLFSDNFDAGLPTGAALHNSAVAEGGVIKITKAINGQSGSVVFDDLDAGDFVNSLDVQFKLRLGGGTTPPADGFSFCWASNLPDADWSEEGVGSGLIVAFDIYDNGGGEAPSIDLKWNGVVIATHPVTIAQIDTGASFVPVSIHVGSDGAVDVTYNGTPIYSHVYINGYAPIAGSRYGFGGRTGGLNENQWIDDLTLTTTTGPVSLAFVRSPADLTGLAGSHVLLSSVVNDPTLVASYQWFKKGPSDAGFSAIPGATDATLLTDTLSLANEGTQFRLEATGPDNIATSSTATLHVVDIPLPPAGLALNFDDGSVPAGTQVFGTAAVTADGGSGGTGTLRLTEAANDQAGAFVIEDFNSGKALDSLVATFLMRAGGGSDVPADGFSFSWGSDIPNGSSATAEIGVGTGLRVGFDVYDNGGGEAPAVRVSYGASQLAYVKLPLIDLATGDEFVPVVIRVEKDGTVDVAYRGKVVVNNVAIPGWTALAAGRFAFAARTGGLNDNFFVDDVQLTTTVFAGNIAITRQPGPAAVLVGSPATFSVEVNDPLNATYRWQEKAPGAGAFTDLAGATGPSYTTTATTAGDNGALFRVVVTGPANSVTSTEAALAAVNLARPASPTVRFDFNSGVPSGTAVYGNAQVTDTGGDADTGVLHLTDAVNGQAGGFLVEDFNGGKAIAGFTAAFLMRMGGGSDVPADGFSLNWATDLANGTFGEDGAGSGLTIGFDIFDNGGGEAPSIDIRWKGNLVASRLVPISLLNSGDGFKEVLVRLNGIGTVDVAYDGQVIHHDVVLPGFNALAGVRFGIGGRTGGLNANQWVDNLDIQTTVFTGNLSFVRQPQSLRVIAGTAVTLSAEVNDPLSATLQWQQKHPADAAFSDIPGANSGIFITPALALADDGIQYRLRASGPFNTVISDPATLAVPIAIPLPEPSLNFDFNDGNVPVGTSVTGSAIVQPSGGVDDSGYLSLTVNQNSLQGAFFVDDINPGETVYGMTAVFDALVGGGTSPPADGFSFNWASDLGGAGFGEEGIGSGLTIAFDIYDNGGGEAPAIDAKFGGSVIGHTVVPLSLIESGNQFVPVIIRVNPNGTLDVAYKGILIYQGLALPDYAGITGGRFAIGGRTGGLNENQFVDNLRITTVTTPPPSVSIAAAPGGAVITFTGTLEQAAQPEGPYSAVTGAVSPLTLPTDQARKFFRSRQ